jgi:succinoglycan biosynthesis transport protein ExoP
MEIKYLIRLLRRNVLYIILGLVLGAGVGIIITKTQTPVYEAATKVFVSRTRQQSNSELLSLTDEQLLAINVQLAKSQLVLNEVAAQMGSKVKADNIEVLTIPNTLIIQIKVLDNDPQRAATVANLLVETLIKQNESLLSGWYTDFEAAITEQIAEVQNRYTTRIVAIHFV